MSGQAEKGVARAKFKKLQEPILWKLPLLRESQKEQISSAAWKSLPAFPQFPQRSY
jgi:hypothetical protein